MKFPLKIVIVCTVQLFILNRERFLVCFYNFIALINVNVNVNVSPTLL